MLSGFRDPQISHALQMIHADPGKPWTVATLASEVAMSRSAFAERFRATVGLAPMGYLADWRLQAAPSRRNLAFRPANTVLAPPEFADHP